MDILRSEAGENMTRNDQMSDFAAAGTEKSEEYIGAQSANGLCICVGLEQIKWI